MNRKNIVAAIAAAAVTVLLAPSCSEDELTTEGFVAQYGKAHCDYLYRCCESREISFGSKAQCTKRIDEAVKALLAFHDREVEGKETKARFAPSLAQSCLGTLAGPCKAGPGQVGCMHEAVVAEGEEGDDCLQDAECKSFNCAVVGDSGSCVSQSVAGGGCGGDDRGCPEEHFCSNAKICKEKIETGKPCDAPSNCSSGICSTSEKICAGANDEVCMAE